MTTYNLNSKVNAKRYSKKIVVPKYFAEIHSLKCVIESLLSKITCKKPGISLERWWDHAIHKGRYSPKKVVIVYFGLPCWTFG